MRTSSYQAHVLEARVLEVPYLNYWVMIEYSHVLRLILKRYKEWTSHVRIFKCTLYL